MACKNILTGFAHYKILVFKTALFCNTLWLGLFNVDLRVSFCVFFFIKKGGGTVSAGAIAGIAVGVLLGVAGIAGIAGLIFYFKKAKQM